MLVLGLPRLLTFAFRALVLLLLISLAWASVATSYNEAVVRSAVPLVPSEVSLKALGSHFVIDAPGMAQVSMDGLTLHFGLVLMAVLVLAAVGLGVRSRLLWLAAMGGTAFILHIAGVALFAWGMYWVGGSASPDSAGRLLMSLFAVFWALIPAVLGAAWCFLYWVPRAAARPQGGSEVHAS